MTQTDEIKARIDIVDLIGESVALRRSGRTFKAPCPFHPEKTPSFIVDPQRQSWHCFGACSEGGDIFSWVMKRQAVDFREALRILADRAGIALAPLDKKAAERDQRRRRLIAANDAAAAFYRQQLLESPDAAEARAYLEKRGLNEEASEAFGLGVALADPDGLHRHLSARGYRSEELEAAGLVLTTERGVVDRFRERLMFPIRDARGLCVGFGGRTLVNEPAKYVNTPQTDVFDKSGLLYGLDRAREAVRAADRVIVVEGYMDVIAAHQHGDAAVVASMGTALTEKQVALIKPLTHNILLALDADAAGAAATMRGIETTRQAVGSHGVRVLDPRGLVRLQDDLSADIRILALPAGRDPDDLIRVDPEEWRRLVTSAQPFLDYRFARAREAHDLDEPRGRSAFAAELLPLVAAVADPVVRAEYVQRLAAAARVDESVLLQRLPRAGGRPGPARSPQAGRAAAEPAQRAGADQRTRFLLALAVSRPEAVEVLDDSLLPLLDDAGAAAILDARLRARDAETWTEALPEPLQADVAALHEYARTLPPYTEDEAREAARDAANRLRRRRLMEGLREQRHVIADEERRHERGRLAMAASALAGGGQGEIEAEALDPDLADAARIILTSQQQAAVLHAQRPSPAAPDTSDAG